jgi:hypothetical protein
MTDIEAQTVPTESRGGAGRDRRWFALLILCLGERPDHLVHLEDRTRPTVAHKKRDRPIAHAFRMSEVEVDVINRGRELWEDVEEPLLFAPVELVQPVVDELLHVGEFGPVRPAGPGSASGQRVCSSRLRRSSSTSSDTLISNGSGVAIGSPRPSVEKVVVVLTA